MVGISGKLSVRHSRSASRSLLDLLASLARLFASSPTGRAQTLASPPCQRRGGIFFGMSKNPLGVDKGAHPLMFIPALATCASKRMKTEGFRTLRVLPPGGPPQRVSSAPSPGAEPHVFCERQNPKTLGEVALPLHRKAAAAIFVTNS